MGCGLTLVDRFLTHSFYHLGVFVGRHPGYFVIIPAILTLLCATGYQKLNYQIDPEYLFSPINGPGKHERAIVEEFFKPNYTSRFNVGRITRPGRFGRIIAIPQDGGDMLRVEVWKELRLLDELIQNTTAHYQDEAFTYKDICARWMDDCFQNDILNLHHVMEEVENRELNLTFPIMFNPVTWDAHAFPVYFGGTEIDEDSLITCVPSAQLVYFVRADNKQQDARGAAWEDAFLDVVGKAEERKIFKYISTARFASRTLDIELERNTRTVVPYFGSTFALMCGFCIITCMMCDWVRSKPYLGLMGTVSATLACISAFGFAMYLDFEFIGINLAAPFLMIGKFISRAQAYFNIQAEALHQIFNGDKEPQILDVNKYLNLIVWIARNVITPAQEIRDEDVGKLLLLRGGELIIKKKKKKKKNLKEENKEATIMVPQRRWTEQNYPKGNPKKNIIRRSILPDITQVHSQSSIRSFRANETEIPISRPESVKLSFPLNIDEESLFLNSSKWYNPFNPEFIYGGPHVKPKNINFVNENDELKWILSGASMKPQPTHPNPVPIFCSELRPIIHSGVSSPMLSENGCWFVMSNLNFYNIENSKKLNTASVQEQLEMIRRLIKTMAHIPKMNIDRFLELTAELCESIEFSNNDETISEMEKLIDDKRTIILEKIFIKFFGSKLRDYNKDTPNYMRIICQRGAVLIRHLYYYTAVELWNQQQQKETEIQEEVQEQEVFKDDAADILKWEEWLQHLSKASHVANVWQKWLQNEIEKDQLPDNREILIQEAKDWIYQGETIRLECQQFLDGAKFLNPIYHRSSLYKSQENIDLSDNDDDDWKSEEIDAQ